ncbi:MAG: tetratricopeptide repeat protein [Pseudomonadota bacterium]
MNTRIVCCLLLLSLGGCATVAPPTEEETAAPVVNEEVTATEAEPHPRPVRVQPKPEDYPAAPFTSDTLYQLLVAEVAGYRGQYDLALEKYLKTAMETRDPGVAARATRLAAYLKRNDAALTTAVIWAEGDPDDIDAHRHAADQLMKAGDLEGAVTHLEAVKRLGGLADFPMFSYRAANLDDASRNALLTVISRMLDEFPGDGQLMFSKAVLLEQNGRLSEALELADALLTDSLNINVIVLKVNALKDLDRLPEAVGFLESTIEQVEDNRRLRLIFARLLFEANRLDDAKAQYEIVRQESPSDGDVLFALALISMEQGKDADAIDYLQQMVRWNRRVGEAHFYLGSIAEKNNDIPTALREYKLAGDGYEFLPAQSRIASLMLDQGRVGDARAYLDSVRGAYPDMYDQLLMVEAQLLSERGLEEQVFDVMDTALQRDPGNIDLLYFRAMTGEKFGRLDILERDLGKIIEMDPDNADALNALGYTLADRTDRYEEALGFIQRAIAIKPDEPAFIDSLGWVLYRLGNYEEAIVHLRRALSLFQNDEVASHLGEVLWVIGEREEARQVWERALEQKPDSTILKKVIERFTAQ